MAEGPGPGLSRCTWLRDSPLVLTTYAPVLMSHAEPRMGKRGPQSDKYMDKAVRLMVGAGLSAKEAFEAVPQLAERGEKVLQNLRKRAREARALQLEATAAPPKPSKPRARSRRSRSPSYRRASGCGLTRSTQSRRRRRPRGSGASPRTRRRRASSSRRRSAEAGVLLLEPSSRSSNV